MRKQFYTSAATVGLLLLAAIFSTPGCATAPAVAGDPSAAARPGRSSATVRIITSSGATLALANNPRYEAAAQGLIVGIDAVTYGDTVLTIEQVTKYVADICVERGLSQSESIVFVSLAHSVYAAYLEDHPDLNLERITLSNPSVKLYIRAFRDGLSDALAVISATRPAAGA